MTGRWFWCQVLRGIIQGTTRMAHVDDGTSVYGPNSEVWGSTRAAGHPIVVTIDRPAISRSKLDLIHAPIYEKLDSSDKTGLLGGQERDGVGYFHWLSDTA